MLSKKSNATARACLHHHKYHLCYVEDYSIRLERKFGKEDGHVLVLVLIDQTPSLIPYQIWRIDNREIAIKSTSTNSNGSVFTLTNVYCDNIMDFATEALQHLSRLLPKLSLTLKLKARSVDGFRKTMKSVESAAEIKEISVEESIWDRNPVFQDELVKVVLDESQRVKHLTVKVKTSDNFEYPWSVPFNLDSVFISSTGWVSRDHFIKLFLSCKKVQLNLKYFNDADLTSIFKAWTEGSRLENLQFDNTLSFDQSKTLAKVFEEFPGAAAVRKAKVPVGSKSEIVSFGEDECFLIQQNDEQTTALVYIANQSVMLSTNFQTGKEVDELAARTDEVPHPFGMFF